LLAKEQTLVSLNYEEEVQYTSSKWLIKYQHQYGNLGLIKIG